MKFECDKCGLCCRHINRCIGGLLDEFDTGNGTCKFLDTETNLCTIYSERPDICSVERAYKKYFSELYTEEKFFRINYRACAELKREHSKLNRD